MRKLLALILAASMLVLAGCGAGSGKTAGEIGPLSSVKITPGADDATAPTVTFDSPLTATTAGAKVIIEGNGETIAENQNVSFKAAAFSTADGSAVGDNFAQDAQSIPTSEVLKTQLPAIYEVLVGTKVGAWVAYVQPLAPTDGTEGAAPATATELMVLKITGTEDIPEPARTLEQSEVEQLEKDGALPTVEFAKDGNPTIAIPEGKNAPEGLAIQILEEGDGKVLTAENTITADYEGVQWNAGPNHEAGGVFDSSYDAGQPASFPLTGVIEGWTKGLTGQKVGSKVLLTIPSSLAYGDDGANGRPSGPLVFIVDIKSAK